MVSDDLKDIVQPLILPNAEPLFPGTGDVLRFNRLGIEGDTLLSFFSTEQLPYTLTKQNNRINQINLSKQV